MLVGRTAGSGLLRRIAAERLFPLALLVTFLGFSYVKIPAFRLRAVGHLQRLLL
jgi:hypothetical protein